MMFALPVDRPTGILGVLCMYLVMDREGGREGERGAPRTDKERCMKRPRGRPAKSSLREYGIETEGARFALATASGLFFSEDLCRVFRENSDFSQAAGGVSCSDPESFSFCLFLGGMFLLFHIRLRHKKSWTAFALRDFSS